MASKTPSLGTLRVATPADVLRVGIVAAAGFRQFQNAIKSNDFVVLVQEDAYLPEENDKTTAIIPSDNGWQPPAAGEKVIVGIISVKLQPDSPRRGQLKNHHGSYPDLPENPGRDLNRRHYDSWESLVALARKENDLDGDSIVSMVVVHPAYWKRGHGTCLATWARDLSDVDQLPQCVSSAAMSQGLFSSLGFQRVCTITAEGDEDDSQGVSTELMEYGRDTPNNSSYSLR